ncbi:hypothetical protein RJ641_009819 [Dillenia turbinata]|uniref:Uncharacterized protein n=1 Tax=Dillenia turbinata TaxID=194707 RepID=A0AAN8UZE6_9MAGN
MATQIAMKKWTWAAGDLSDGRLGWWNRESRRRIDRVVPFGKGRLVVLGSSNKDGGSGKPQAKAVPNSNYVVPLDKSASCMTRPLAEILRDLNKKIPDNILKPNSTFIPWYHANRMLSFYAPGWCGEIRDVIFSDNGNASITVVYRVTIRGSDGETFDPLPGCPKVVDLVTKLTT